MGGWVSIGLAIFASVVLILAVYHTGFRKVLLWTVAVVVALSLVGGGAYYAYDQYTTNQATAKAATERKFDIESCMRRLGAPSGAPDTLPPIFFDIQEACTAAPDENGPWAQYRSRTFDGSVSHPEYFAFDRRGRVIIVATVPCSNSLLAGYVMDIPCVMSGNAIAGFRREMCIGEIYPNGDCHISADSVQLCPYGLAIQSVGECAPFGDVDTTKEQQKLTAYRETHPLRVIK
jgi:hypothetical protein